MELEDFSLVHAEICIIWGRDEEEASVCIEQQLVQECVCVRDYMQLRWATVVSEFETLLSFEGVWEYFSFQFTKPPAEMLLKQQPNSQMVFTANCSTHQELLFSY